MTFINALDLYNDLQNYRQNRIVEISKTFICINYIRKGYSIFDDLTNLINNMKTIKTLKQFIEFIKIELEETKK